MESKKDSRRNNRSGKENVKIYKRRRKEESLKNAIEVAKNMLKENFDIDLISRLTGLKKEQFM